MKDTVITRVPYEPGRLVMTPSVPENFEPVEVFRAITRHLSCDWGDIGDADWRANDEAVRDGDRLVSVYRNRDMRLLIVTEADRSATTVMLPSDY